MPAKSKKQQRFMGMVHKCQKTGECASPKVEKTASSMKKKDAKDFASTKHKGLPEKTKKRKKKANESLVCESLDAFLKESASFYFTDLLVEILMDKGLSYEEADFAVGQIEDNSLEEWEMQYRENPSSLLSIADNIMKYIFKH